MKETLRETMPIRVLPQDGEFYINRLTKLCELRHEIDAGLFGQLVNWGTDNAVDPVVYTDHKSGQTKVRKTYTSLPMRRPSTGREKGLRYGVLFSIYGTRNILHDMGLGAEADAILLFDSKMAGGRNGKR